MWAVVAIAMAFSIGGAGASYILTHNTGKGRHLSEEQKGALLNVLRRFKGRVRISHAPTEDCAGYGRDFSEVFRQAGWEPMRRELLNSPQALSLQKDTEPRYGLYVLCNHDESKFTESCEPLMALLREQDIEYSGPWVVYGMEEPEIEIRIYPSPYDTHYGAAVLESATIAARTASTAELIGGTPSTALCRVFPSLSWQVRRFCAVKLADDFRQQTPASCAGVSTVSACPKSTPSGSPTSC